MGAPLTAYCRRSAINSFNDEAFTLEQDGKGLSNRAVMMLMTNKTKKQLMLTMKKMMRMATEPAWFEHVQCS